jgi:hypothetical protein
MPTTDSPEPIRITTEPMQIASSLVEHAGWLGLAESVRQIENLDRLDNSTVAAILHDRFYPEVQQAATHLLISRFFDRDEIVPQGAGLVLRMPDGTIRERSR